MTTGRFELSVDDLRGRQSVRATFRLPKQVIDLLSVIASQMGIKQKSLFDQLVENASILSQVAAEAHGHTPGDTERRQKTFVLSRSSLTSLEHIARQQHIQRDVLVEYSIRRLLPVVESERKRHEKRKILLEDLQAHLQHGQEILDKAQELIGEDDQLYQMIAQEVSLCERHVAILGEMVERGKPMETW